MDTEDREAATMTRPAWLDREGFPPHVTAEQANQALVDHLRAKGRLGPPGRTYPLSELRDRVEGRLAG